MRLESGSRVGNGRRCPLEPNNDLMFKIADNIVSVFPAVVWNPWKDKSREMADFDDDGWRYMLCVEAGKVVSPVVLEAGAAFECSVSFTVNPEHHGL